MKKSTRGQRKSNQVQLARAWREAKKFGLDHAKPLIRRGRDPRFDPPKKNQHGPQPLPRKKKFIKPTPEFVPQKTIEEIRALSLEYAKGNPPTKIKQERVETRPTPPPLPVDRPGKLPWED